MYGTLKYGYGNHRVMEKAGGSFISKCVTIDKFKMTDVGFPYIAFSQDGFPVLGELYLVNDLKPLDSLEGYPNHYSRRRISVKDEYGKIHNAYVYYVGKSKLHGNPVEPINDEKFGTVLCWRC